MFIFIRILKSAPGLCFALLAMSCGHEPRFQERPAFPHRPSVPPPPAPPREFRAAWIATVANIDWPSRPGLPAAEQKKEFSAILDHAVQLKLNALVFQVRPACDALYVSKLEPWSEFLTGEMGRAPSPAWDPLAFAVEESHRRGLELHAWFNPFRARQASTKTSIAPSHVSRTRPDLVRRYGRLLWLDPGEKGAQEHVLAVILDVVRRYDIDGVHIDDYFYPYKQTNSAGKKLDFPDEKTWNRYRSAGGKLSRSDWRRKNIDDFVQTLHQRIKSEKAWLKFGISPFGIWRPGFPPQITGADSYEEIFADSRKWLREGWIDYWSPQLYWRIQSPGQSYPVLLQWWVEQNVRGRHVWPGISSANLVTAGWPPAEIVNQIRATRRQTGATGNIFWNSSSLRKRPDLTDLLKEIYTQAALIPASPWLDHQPPSRPIAGIERRGSFEERVRWEPTGVETVWLWVVQRRVGNYWQTDIFPRHVRSAPVQPASQSDPVAGIAVTAVDRSGNTSSPVVVEIKPAPKWPTVGAR